MATFFFSPFPNMNPGQGATTLELSRIGSYDSLTLTGTSIKLFDGIAGNAQLTGTGFSVTLGSGISFPTGTITGLKIVEAGITMIQATGLNLNLGTVTGLLQANNDSGLRAYITSGNDTFNGTKLGDTLLGGAGMDKMLGLGGADLLVGEDGADRIVGAGGNDLLIGGNGRDSLLGGAGNDFLQGDNAVDTLLGSKGNDTLNGGLGNDVLTGGAGADSFTFFLAPGVEGIDTITDFVSGVDEIGVDPSSFGIPLGDIAAASFRLGKFAKDADDRFIYDKATGSLYFDADGTGGTAQVQFAKLTAGTTLVATDIAGVLYL